MSNETVIVKLLDKEYQVACPPGQQQALTQSANYLDSQMRSIRANGKVIGLERIAVMAALNISNELLQQGPVAEEDTKLAPNNAQLKGLNDRLDEALHRFRQLEIG
ncbi:cell division protein ZapA [Oceanicoccus sp. KOV_DT_Chl]|uniref:cell division protein ZapA n=1 Tax=Oceanicoccus sp. KOV_DT_Chl TaxID=1904639 RepID=UPI000C7D3904|nr:cell division protein ZapA [Oceanicoccus sp. KOV_DT_Chl]